MLCDDLEGWDREVGGGLKRGGYGDMCVHMADSLCCATETNTVL